MRPRLEVLVLDLRPRRLAVAGALLAAYSLAPLPLLRAVEASDSYSVSTLRQKERRVGSTISLDRASFRLAAAGGLVELWTGDIVRAVGAIPEHDARVSLTGTFLQRDVLRVERFVEHRKSRDWPTYLALSILGVLWARPFLGRASPPAPTRRAAP